MNLQSLVIFTKCPVVNMTGPASTANKTLAVVPRSNVMLPAAVIGCVLCPLALTEIIFPSCSLSPFHHHCACSLCSGSDQNASPGAGVLCKVRDPQYEETLYALKCSKYKNRSTAILVLLPQTVPLVDASNEPFLYGKEKAIRLLKGLFH